MPSLPWRRRGRSTEPGEHTALIEAAVATRAAPAAPVVPPSRGYPEGIPLGGTTKQNPGYQGDTDRRTFMDQLYAAYLACPWSSASVDVIARTVTAGGLILTPDDDSTDRKPGPQVTGLQQLFDFVNPREDARQLARGIITDLLIFGDAFLELVWFAGRPVAVYSLDCPSMIPLADEHGTVGGYAQVLDPNRTVDFAPAEVIQISLDSPRGGLYGVSPTQKCLLPITAWLFTAGLLKETMRKGNPGRLHVDHPLEMDSGELERWRQKYAVTVLGIQNIGEPVTTRGGATVKELAQNQIAEYLATLNQKRDEIIAGYGVPPRKLGIAESGQLGGTGEGTTQDRTFRVNTCGPVAETVLEKLTFRLAREAFGIPDWGVRFGDVDWRDDKVVEDIRDQRIRNGSWTLNRARAEIGEPPIDGGDEPVLVDRQNLVLWSDLSALSHAQVAALDAKASTTTGVGALPQMPSPNESLAEAAATGGVTMVALFPPADLAAALAVDGGLPADDLHVTLAYLGADDVDVEKLAAVVAGWAAATAPVELTLSGMGLFGGQDGPVTWLSVDAPGLAAARERLVGMLVDAGLPVSTVHGFSPHLTLAYADRLADVVLPESGWTVAAVTVAAGADRTVFPLTGAAESDPAVGLVEAWRVTYAERRRRALAEL